MDDNQNLSNMGEDSLESVETTSQGGSPSIGADGGETLDSSNVQAGGAPDDSPHSKPKRSLSQRVQSITGKLNIYLLLFVLVILLSAIAAYASYRASKNAANSTNINGQTLSASDLQSLKNNDTQVGDAKQTLTIASNAIFNGRVLVRDSLDVAGTIRVGGTLSLPGITVSGTSAFENVQIGNNLSIAGNAAVQGTLTVQKNLTVGGGATFAGTISAPALAIDALILNQNLQLNRHIEAGGARPSASAGSAIGSGGTVSVNGSDTAGNVQLHFGGSPGAGILARITFANSFNQTPHVVITPVSSSCADLRYYVSRTTGGFDIGTNNSGYGDCSFDYIAMD
jgi:cytoskeletal protein CcmA (bactofilin family)